MKPYINSLHQITYKSGFDEITGQFELVTERVMWNVVHFAIVRTVLDNTKLRGLIHLPTNRIVTYGTFRQLKKIAKEMDNWPYSISSWDLMPPAFRKKIFEFIEERSK